MTNILLASSFSLILALFGTPIAIRFMRRRNLGQHIREDGPQAHHVKKGTPTMGGFVIIGAALVAYVIGHFSPLTCFRALREVGPVTAQDCIARFTSSGLLAMGAIMAMAALGFIDDYLKIRKRRSLGLNKFSKIVGQLAIAFGFAYLAGMLGTQAQAEVSLFRPLGLDLGVLFFAWVFLIISAASNGVNLSDGLDGLASGSVAMVMGAYVIIAFWQWRHPCSVTPTSGCYIARHALDLAMVSAGMLGATSGFLWWNAAPAKIFMGDTGSMALGGAMGALAILTNTQLLLIVIGGLYVIEVTSVVIQVISFRLFNRRVFLMAPVHHHFELLGWPEFTVIVRFWILAGLSIAFGLGLFYADFIAQGGID
jgi:phospho-N-acetylmuramoyl-pentapeptide-transferase